MYRSSKLIIPPAAIPGTHRPNLDNPGILQDTTAHQGHKLANNPGHHVRKYQSAEVDTFTGSISQDVAPAWFAAALDIALRPIIANQDSMKNDLEIIKADIASLKDEIASLKNEVIPIKADVAGVKVSVVVSQQSAARFYNAQCEDGTEKPYKVLLFNNGTSPVDAGLPALSDIYSFYELTSARANAYATGYNLPGQLARMTLAKKKTAIASFIGSTSYI